MEPKLMICCARSVVAIAVFSTFVIPAGAASPSFDCKKASSEVEKAICNDETIGHLDLMMATFYRQARENNDKTALKQQRAWFKIRNRCKPGKNYNCLLDAYMERLQVLAEKAGDKNHITGLYGYRIGPNKQEGREDWYNSGSLRLVRQPDGNLTGIIETISGPTYHTCNLEMTAMAKSKTGWRWKDLDPQAKTDEKNCQVSLIPKGDGFSVSANGACRYYCGMRGFFEETYRRAK